MHSANHGSLISQGQWNIKLAVMDKEEPRSVKTTAGLEDTFWDKLLRRIQEKEVVPLVGPGAVTFGDDDELLYPWLAQLLPGKLDLPLAATTTPRDLQEVVDAQRATGELEVALGHRLVIPVVAEAELIRERRRKVMEFRDCRQIEAAGRGQEERGQLRFRR